jgi:hypothetical protein
MRSAVEVEEVEQVIQCFCISLEWKFLVVLELQVLWLSATEEWTGAGQPVTQTITTS